MLGPALDVRFEDNAIWPVPSREPWECIHTGLVMSIILFSAAQPASTDG